MKSLQNEKNTQQKKILKNSTFGTRKNLHFHRNNKRRRRKYLYILTFCEN